MSYLFAQLLPTVRGRNSNNPENSAPGALLVLGSANVDGEFCSSIVSFLRGCDISVERDFAVILATPQNCDCRLPNVLQNPFADISQRCVIPAKLIVLVSLERSFISLKANSINMTLANLLDSMIAAVRLQTRMIS
jgi:hypothetical protein